MESVGARHVSTFTIDGRGVRSFEDFVEATNVGFIELVGGWWDGNLDALNDYLSWREPEEYELVIVDSADCARSLGHAARATWLRQHLVTCHPSNVADMRSRLALAEAGLGETLFDVVLEIIGSNARVRLVLR